MLSKIFICFCVNLKFAVTGDEIFSYFPTEFPPYKKEIVYEMDPSRNFVEYLISKDIYVDKSLLIKELVENPNTIIAFTKPKGWGKTMNMNMLRKFFEIEIDHRGILLPMVKRINPTFFLGGITRYLNQNKTLHPLKISTYQDVLYLNLGRFPVVYLNFEDIEGENYQEILENFTVVIKKTFKCYKYLTERYRGENAWKNKLVKEEFKFWISEKITFEDFYRWTKQMTIPDLQRSLLYLTEKLNFHYNRQVVLLIDNYDAPINRAYLNFGRTDEPQFKKIFSFFQTLWQYTFELNSFLKKGILMGNLPLEIFPKYVKKYGYSNKEFAEYFGFTKVEVESLINNSLLNVHLRDVKHWYNGYQIGGKDIYNPSSVTELVYNKGNFNYYWSNSSIVHKIIENNEEIYTDCNLKQLIANTELGLIKLITNKINYNNLSMYDLLVVGGYLNAQPTEHTNFYNLHIPNKEVRHILKQISLNNHTRTAC